jgi:hypothetical protein
MNRSPMCLCSDVRVFASNLPRGSGSGAYRKKRFDCVASLIEAVFGPNLFPNPSCTLRKPLLRKKPLQLRRCRVH